MSAIDRRLLAAAACLAACAPAGVGATAARAQDGPKSLIAKFRDWEAHKTRVGGVTVCYAAAVPIKSKGKYRRRGETSLLISFWPERKIRGQVEVRAGYRYKDGSAATLTFNNGAKFRLRAEGDGAWARNEAADRKIVKQLSDRARLTVTGRSWRGTLTVDTYSLTGFRAAFARARTACGM